MDVTFKDNELRIWSKKVKLDRPIFDIIVLEDRVIVTENWDDIPKGDPLLCRNVITVGTDGEILWRIAHSKRSEVKDDSGKIVDKPNPWVGGNVMADGEVQICDADGMAYVLNVDSGEVAKGRFVK